jgi:hypothetical protein
MKCIGHADVDAVGTCVRCGCGLCQSCISGTFYRVDNKPLCGNCNYEICLERLQFLKSSLRSNKISLRIFQVALVVGLIAFIYNFITGGSLEDGIMSALFFCLLGGVLADRYGRQKQTDGSVRSQVYGALFDFHNPIASIFVRILVVLTSAILTPIVILRLVSNISKVKKQIVEDETILNKIQAGAA